MRAGPPRGLAATHEAQSRGAGDARRAGAGATGSRRLALPLLVALALALTSCRLVDNDQARLCRMLAPVLNSADTVINVTRASSLPTGYGVRIDYIARPPGQAPLRRVLFCRFESGGLARARLNLAAVATEQGPLGDGQVFLLRHFYLAAPDAQAEDPGDPSRAIGLPLVPKWVAYGAQQTVAALPLAAIYALLAAAYAVIYGLAGRIVFGFGAFAAIGGYGALLGVTLLQAQGAAAPALGLGLVLAVAAAAGHGVAAGRLVVAPLLRGPALPALIGTAGLMIALGEYLRLAQGNDLRWIAPLLNRPVPILRGGDFVTTVTPMALLTAGGGALVLSALMALLKFSAFGRAWRAYADDPVTAALFGVDAGRVLWLSFALAAGLSGFAGFAMTAYYGGVGYGAGLDLGLKALVAAILGGIGSVGGALTGGLLIGLAEALWSATMPIESRDIAIFAVLALVLILRPGGLFGYADLSPRRV